MMASKVSDSKVNPLGLLDISIDRKMHMVGKLDQK